MQHEQYKQPNDVIGENYHKEVNKHGNDDERTHLVDVAYTGGMSLSAGGPRVAVPGVPRHLQLQR